MATLIGWRLYRQHTFKEARGETAFPATSGVAVLGHRRGIHRHLERVRAVVDACTLTGWPIPPITSAYVGHGHRHAHAHGSACPE